MCVTAQRRGIYEPEVVRRLAVNEAIRLTTAMADRHDGLRQPRSARCRC